MKDNQDSILKQFNLPSYVKGKTFAEASKAINERFKDQDDADSQATLKELQERLQAAQEFVKAQSDPSTSTNPGQPAVAESMNGDQNISQGGEQAAGMQDPAANVMRSMNANGEGGPNKYFLGGDLFKKSEFGAGLQEGATGEEVSGSIGAGLGALSGAAELGNMAFGKTGIDTSGVSAAPQVQSKGGAAAGGAMKGVQAGMQFGPWGAAIGGVVGGVAGLVGRGKAAEDANIAAVNHTSAQDKKFNNSYADGGNLFDKFKDLEVEEGPARAMLSKMDTPEMQGLAKVGDNHGTFNEQIAANKAASNKTTSTPGNINSDSESDSGAKFNPGALLRYAPAAANAYQLATLKKPAQEGYDRLGNVYDKQLVDEKGLQNTVAQDVAGMRDRLVSTSGGSGSTARANLLASQLQGTKALSDAYMKSEDLNRGENRAAQEFKLNVDKTNLGQSNIQTQANAQNQGAYDSQKSALIAQLGDDFGGVGQEELFKQYPELMGMDYNTRGEYLAKLKAEKEKKNAARNLAKMA
jgi:hypothetical protein